MHKALLSTPALHTLGTVAQPASPALRKGHLQPHSKLEVSLGYLKFWKIFVCFVLGFKPTTTLDLGQKPKKLFFN